MTLNLDLSRAFRRPMDMDYLIERDRELRHQRIEPVATELLLGAVDRARASGLVTRPGLADG
jgi:hypothetical protein